MKRKLNATAIRNAKSKEKPFKLADGGGLYLEVKPSGGKFWRYRYRVMGKENIFAIGSLMDASLEEARKHHGETCASGVGVILSGTKTISYACAARLS
jgi:hypothetical protein